MTTQPTFTGGYISPQFQQAACDSLNDPVVQKRIAMFVTFVILLALALLVAVIINFVLSSYLSK